MLQARYRQATGGPAKRESTLAPNPIGMRSAGSTISIPTKLLATGVACAVALLVCGTAATVVVASEATSKLSNPMRVRLWEAARRPAVGPGFREMDVTAATTDSGARYATAFGRDLANEEASPDSRAAETFAADTTQHPRLRVDALGAIALGGCRNLPEVVFGFSPLRRAAMARAVANLSDIDHGPELGARYVQFLDYAMTLGNAPGAPPPGSVLDRNGLLNALAWIVPPGVRARAFLCVQHGL